MTPLTTLVALAVLASTSDAVLVEFGSDHCAPCRTMQPAVSRLISDGYPVQRIDTDRHPETARQFGVRALPTFILLVGGQEAGRVEGATSYDRLARLFPARPPANQPASGAPREIALVSAEEPLVAPREARSRLEPTEFRGGGPAEAALAASVRLRVEDAKGYGFGTGTIVDIHGNEALVVTCGHLFRESQGKGAILVDLFAPGATQPVAGQLISYDLQRDIALVSLRPGVAVTPAIVAPPGFAVRQRDRAFTVGCDKGAQATVRNSEITAVNRYLGKPNFSAAGAPIDGRSGGGLFSEGGLLIGICNAADPQNDEGLYAGLDSIHWQLDQIGQSEIYQRASRTAQVAAGESPPAELRTAEPRAALAGNLPPRFDVQAPPLAAPLAVTPASFSTPQPAGPVLNEDSELVVIIRSKHNPQQRSEIYVVDQASPELLTGIIHAARRGTPDRSAQDRSAALVAGQTAAGFDAQRLSQRERRQAQPVVRGQSGD